MCGHPLNQMLYRSRIGHVIDLRIANINHHGRDKCHRVIKDIWVEIVAEEVSVRSHMSFTDQSVHPQGWSTHELALFCRAATLLSSESLCVETDYGLTDEGEPWLVFCDSESGDILGHFARMDDQYVACVPFRRGALRGWELSGLLSRFLWQRGIAWSTATRPILRNVDKLAALGFVLQQCA